MTDIYYKQNIDKLYKRLYNVLQSLEKYKYKDDTEKKKFEDDIMNILCKFDEFKREKLDPETFYKNVVKIYKKNIRDKLKEISSHLKPVVPNLKSTFPKTEEEPEPEQEQEPEQPEQQEPETETEAKPEQPKPTNPTFPKGRTLHDTITPKPEPEEEQPEPEEEQQESEEEEEQPEPEEEEEQPEPGQQLVPVNNSQQMVPTPEQNYKLMEKEIEEFKKNPQLDIITGVGEVIEYMAHSNLTDEMMDELIDQMLGLKDSHGNLLFSNRFQIEDLVRNRKKRKRLRYLLPKRIINAEKPDEQKLIINPMLRRGRIASMTSAKERYYNYV